METHHIPEQIETEYAMHAPKQNKLQQVRQWFGNQHLFAKLAILFLAIITLVTPIFIAGQHIFYSHASNGLPSTCIQAPSCVQNGTCPNITTIRGVNWCNFPTTFPTPPLSGAANTTIISHDATVTASATYQNNIPQNVISSSTDPSLYWNSGAFPTPTPQWILLTLKNPSIISKITLIVGQYPSGQTTHEVYVGSSPDTLVLVKTFSGSTQTGDTLTVSFPSAVANSTYIKIVTTQSPSWVAWRRIMVYGNISISPHLQYFGYYFGLDGINSQQMMANSMYIPSPTVPGNTVAGIAQQDVTSLTALQTKHMKGIVDVSGIFFDTQTWNLLPDWAQRWNSYWTVMYRRVTNIYAFYPIDEPDTHITPAVLASVTHAIKSSVDATFFPIPIMVVLSPSGVLRVQNNLYTLPLDVGLLGFDEYGCEDTCFGGEAFAQKYAVVEAIAKQRGIHTVMIGDGYDPGYVAPSSQAQAAWVQRDQDSLSLCNASPQCVAYVVFLYDSLPQIAGGIIGVKDMPVLFTYLQTVGQQVINMH